MNYTEWKRNINRKLRRRAEEDRDSGRGVLFHSIFYHNYLEGYKEVYETDANGKRRLKRTYVGMWYVQRLSRTQYILLRLLYVLLFAAMIALVAFAALSQRASGSALYVVIPEILVVCMFFRILYILAASYLFAPKKMTINDYETSSGAIRNASLVMAVSTALCGAGSLIYGLIHGSLTAELAPAGLFLLAGLTALVMNRIEHGVPYDEVFNENAETAQGLEID